VRRGGNKLNQSNLTTLSNADIVSNASRKSRRSRVKTAISRNQDFIRSSFVDNSHLKNVLSKVKDYKINPQLLNGVRYETYRLDTGCKDWMFGKQFKDIYRNFNIRMSVEDQKLVYNFLRVDKNPMEALTPRDDDKPES
jgi:hypothetical protein